MADSKDNMHFQQAVGGMNMDSASGQKPQGAMSFVLNGQIQGFDGEAIVYQAEQSNEYYTSLPPMFRVIGGPFNITQINRVLFFLANPDTGDSQIGWIDNEDGVYKIGVEGACLGLDIKFPIHQIVVKTINCSTQVYWTDNNNYRRYLDFDNLPWKEVKNPNNDFQPIQLVGQLDCNKLLVQPHFSVPNIFATKEIVGGQLKMGAYQATVQYADVLGNGLTDYYNVSNPFGIFKSTDGGNFDLPTDKAIVYRIEDLDTSGLYDFFNITIVKTINDITSVELVARAIPITGETSEYTYTGTEQDAERLTITDVFQKKAQYFDKAAGVTSVDDVIVWYDLTSSKDINYQKIANAIKVGWETYKIPYNDFEAYKNGVNTAEYRGHMRDEVYTLSWVPILRTGEQKQQFPIPGRQAVPTDLEEVDNADAINILEDLCATPIKKYRWEVYNTATKIGYSPEYLAYTGEDGCYKGPYEYGEMAYWQSTRRFPNNPSIWGSYAGQPICHHKFPDNAITPIHDNNTTADRSFEHSIFPIGFKISGIKEAIDTSSLSQEEKDNIVGFKIVRGNRAGNNSIIAKGMFNNVGRYTYEPDGVDEPDDSQTYYYPNYPFNDLRPDPYFTQNKIKDHTGYRPDKSLKGFESDDAKSRFVFYSPDTQFKQPFGINAGYLKLETIEYGESYGHFTPVDENAKYLFLNSNGYKIAYGAGIASTINGTVSYTTPWDYQVGGTFSPENFPSSFQGMLDLLSKILPKRNFGYSFNSIGYYNKSFPVPNDGNKVRAISYGKYLNPEYNNIEDGNTINNFQRESSVYLHTAGNFKYPHEYSNTIPKDTSRYNIASYKNTDTWGKFVAIYLANRNVVTDDDIKQALVENGYSGPPVFGFLNVIPPTGTVPAIGSLYDYYDSNGTFKGTFKVLEVLGPVLGPYSLLTTLESGTSAGVTDTMTADASDHSGTGFVEFLYINNNTVITNNNNLVLQGTTLPTTFESASVTSYQIYTTANANNNIASLVFDVRTIYASVNTETDLTNLDVRNPSNINDFEKQIGYGAFGIAHSRYANANQAQFSLSKDRKANICSYYGSIKRIVPDQWGDIYSYSTIDTGFYSELRDADGNINTSFKTIFGGDTFINRHAFKIKLPFFEDNTVKDDDQTDIEYDKIATLTYPMFWVSTRSIDIRSDLVKYVEEKARQIINNGGTLEAIEIALAGVYSLQLAFHILKEVLYTLGIKNLNLDNFSSKDLYEQGIMYLFAYGIPYYFCESNINTDYRHANNSAEGNFYPNVGEEIPDEWVQEANVSIQEAEQFSYNDTYSKQNKENYYAHLRLDYDPDKACYYYHNNLAVWSDQSSLEETKNNWLTYRPGNRFNFPKEFGKLTALDRLQNKVVLARFENRSRLYNSMVKIDTSTPYAAALGNDSLFSGAPAIDLSDSSGGSFGSQHKFILNTEQGDIFIDSNRGQIALLRGQQVVDIAQAGMDKWFKHFLPFFIKKIDNGQAVDIDNSWNAIGYCGVYDSLYKRVIITKKDYEPLVEGISYNDNGQYIFAGNVIELTDSTYFCDRSWTLSYSFITNSWTSFHSYQPSFYIEYPKHFQTGINKSVTSVYSHNTSFTSYHNYYGTTYPYILEYPIAYGYEDEILQGVSDYTKSLKYTDYETYTSPKETYYFNKAIIYNDQQCSGILNLVAKGGLGSYGRYPIYNGDSKDIQVTKTDNCFNFNTFWNITVDTNEPIWNKTCEFKYTNKTLNFSNLDYTNKSYKKAPIRGKETYIRLISDVNTNIRLVSRFIISPTKDSKI